MGHPPWFVIRKFYHSIIIQRPGKMSCNDEQKLRDVFQQMDLVDDDKITKEELKNALTNHLGFSPEDADLITEV